MPKVADGTEAPTPSTVYEVRNAVSGSVEGRHEKKADAKRECDRLNLEAMTGMQKPTALHPHGQVINAHGPGGSARAISHRGDAVEYEVVTTTGVIVA